MKAFFKKWWHGLFGLYAFFYMPAFSYLEKTVVTDYNLIHCPLDDKIPFCEYFIIPYLFWFLFIGIGCVYFFIKSQGECVRLASFLVVGMTIAVATFFLYPNGLGSIRPDPLPRDNFCSDLVKTLYKADTSTNVLPSLHVFNTLVMVIAVFESKTFKRKTAIRISVSIIGILICLATVFLKQHSVYDVIAGFALAAVLYPVFYKTKFFRKF